MARLAALALVAALALAACGGDAAPVGPAAIPAGIPDEGALLRLPADGGTAMLYRADSLLPLEWRVPRNVPPISRALGTDIDDEMVYAVDRRDDVVGIDLKAQQARTYLTEASHLSGTADGAVLGLDSARHPLRFAGRDLSTFRGTVAGGRDARLLPASGNRVVAYSPAEKLVQVFEDDGEAARFDVPAGQLTTTWAGDLMAITTDSGIVLAYSSPARDRKPWFVAVKGAPVTAAFSPSGHRLYVARARGDIVLLDRFNNFDQVGEVPLPAPAIDVRTDRSGRWLLARPEQGDSVWLVDLVREERTATIPSPWAADLPLVSGGRTMITRDGKDILAWDLTSASPEPRTRLNGAADDIFLAVPWRPRDQRRTPRPPDLDELARTVPDATPADTGDTLTAAIPVPGADQYFIQVTSTQNRGFAEATRDQLTGIGFRAKVREPATEGDGFKVLIGPYATREEAEADGKRLGMPYFIRTQADPQP